MAIKKEKGQLIVLYGPSGVGKSTVIALTSISLCPTPPVNPVWGSKMGSIITL